MADLKIIYLDAREHHGTALLDADDAVWVAIAPQWWDLATWAWWFLCPFDKRAFAILNTDSKRRVRVRVIRVAKRHVRFRGVPDKAVGE